MTRDQQRYVKKLLAGKRQSIILNMSDRRRVLYKTGLCRYTEYIHLANVAGNVNGLPTSCWYWSGEGLTKSLDRMKRYDSGTNHVMPIRLLSIHDATTGRCIKRFDK